MANFTYLVDSQPELIAHHDAEAGLAEQTIHNLQKSGERYSPRSAFHEAIGHLGKGLEIIRELPENPELGGLELAMLIMSAPALVTARGYAASEVEPTYHRAFDLCRKFGEVHEEFPVLLGQSMFHFLRADIGLPRELANQADALAKTSGEPGSDLTAHRQVGLVACFQGEFEFSAASFDKVIDTYDIEIHGQFAPVRGGADFGVAALATSGYALVPLGYPDQAKRRCAKALALAKK